MAHPFLPEPEAKESDLALLQRMIDSSDDGFAALDPGYHFVAFNRIYRDDFQRVFGCRLEYGMSLEEALADHPRDLAIGVDQWSRALRGNEFTVTSEFGDPARRVVPYEIHYHCVRGADDRVLFAFQRVRDLSDRMALANARALLDRERRDEYLRLAESAANVGLWHWDASTRLVAGSPEWRRLQGLPAEKHHTTLAELFATIHPQDAEHLQREYGAAVQNPGGRFSVEFRAIHPDGSMRWLFTQGRPVFNSNGEVESVFGVTVDINDRKCYEQDLAKVTQRLEAHLQNTPIAVVEFSTDFEVVRFSEEAERLFGWKASEIVGKRILDFRWVHEDDVQRVRNIMNAMMAGTQEKIFVANRNYRKDGSVIHCEWYNSALLDQNGKLTSVLSFAADVTGRHLAEAALRDSERKFRTTFELAAVGMARVGLDGRWLEVNRKFCEILGYTADELIGGTFLDLTHPDDAQPNLRLFVKALGGEREYYSMEKRYVHKSGTSVWTDLTAALVRTAGGEPAYFISVVQDITARKAAEAALRRSNEDLRNFAYAAAHDLQEPLRTILAHTQLLSRRLGPSLNANDKELMGYIFDGATRLEELIRGLREYMEIADRGTELAALVDLNVALQKAVQNLSAMLRESGATLNLGQLPVVRGLELHFIQLFQNLLSNAIKYARPGTPVVIQVEAAGGGSKDWVITVADNGIGIAPAYQARIFGVFKRLHGREVPGTGIGLAICSKIVERYGGRIWVESEPGKGSRFSFSLATGSPATLARAQSPQTAP